VITREAIVAEARSWIGTPWKHNQIAKGAGADCLGFLAGIAFALGYADARLVIRDPKFRAYGRSPDPAMLDDACETYLDPIEVSSARLADIIRIVPPRGVYAQHFGLVSRVDAFDRPTHIIHCTNAYPRAVTEHSLNDDWRGRIKRAYAWRGVA
jgi:hypothetical protein